MTKTKKKNDNSSKLKKVIKELDLKNDDKVVIHIYGQQDQVVDVGDIENKVLNKKVDIVQKNAGGIEYGYKLYKFILGK